MATIVLVPDAEGVTQLSGLDGVRPVRYAPGEPLPLEAADAEVLIPAPGAGEETAALLPRLPKVKLIQLLTADVEQWAESLPAGILLSTCRGAHGGSTAEWAVAMLLSIYRELSELAADQREHRWRSRMTDTLQDKRVLILGAGQLGMHLRRRLEPFDATVTMVGLKHRTGVHGHDELPDLLPQQEAVVVMVPLTPVSRGMVNAEFLAALPDGAVVVNASRGPVVDSGALLAELRAGRLRAALDVMDPEPLPVDDPLWSAPGLLLTPHVAGNVRGGRRRSYAVAAEEIQLYVNGELPNNLVHGEY